MSEPKEKQRSSPNSKQIYKRVQCKKNEKMN